MTISSILIKIKGSTSQTRMIRYLQTLEQLFEDSNKPELGTIFIIIDQVEGTDSVFIAFYWWICGLVKVGLLIGVCP